MAGNPNPSPETRFKPGNSGNPGGKTSEHQLRDLKTADMASQFRLLLLSAVQEKLALGVNPLELLSPEVIRILKDSEDRAHGTPKQSVDVDAKLAGGITVSWQR